MKLKREKTFWSLECLQTLVLLFVFFLIWQKIFFGGLIFGIIEGIFYVKSLFGAGVSRSKEPSLPPPTQTHTGCQKNTLSSLLLCLMKLHRAVTMIQI